MGYGWTMEGWDPRLVHALARHNRVVMFDNSGVGRTQELPPPLTIEAMADQTSALIGTLGLGRPDVPGWSMGGMIAQALADLHPAQVRRLVLCATYPGTGAAVPPSRAALAAGSDFPANQVKAYTAFKAAIAEYPAAPAASVAAKGSQTIASADWQDGIDATGRKVARISVPTLIADGTEDQLDPVANDHILARLIPRARLVLYPDASATWPRGPRSRTAAGKSSSSPRRTACHTTPCVTGRTTARAYAEPERHTGNPFTVYEVFNRWPDRAELVTSKTWTVSEARKLARARSGRAGLRNPDGGPAWAVRDDLIGIHHPCVYRLLDSGGRVIYAGKTTGDMVGPIGRHRRKFWWSEVAGVETLTVPLQALDEREATEIHPAHPKYNNHCPRCGVLLNSRKAV